MIIFRGSPSMHTTSGGSSLAHAVWKYPIKLQRLALSMQKQSASICFLPPYLLSLLFMLRAKITDQKTLIFRYLSALIIVAAAFFCFKLSHTTARVPNLCLSSLVGTILDRKTQDSMKSFLFCIQYSLFSFSTTSIMP